MANSSIFFCAILTLTILAVHANQDIFRGGKLLSRGRRTVKTCCKDEACTIEDPCAAPNEVSCSITIACEGTTTYACSAAPVGPCSADTAGVKTCTCDGDKCNNKDVLDKCKAETACGKCPALPDPNNTTESTSTETTVTDPAGNGTSPAPPQPTGKPPGTPAPPIESEETTASSCKLELSIIVTTLSIISSLALKT